MPIQGTAADTIKISMIKIQNHLNEMNIESKMILQVHDELVFESKTEDIELLNGIIIECMTTAINMDVPLKVELKTGHNWGNMKPVMKDI